MRRSWGWIGRTALAAGIALGWLAMVALMWKRLWTPPPPEVLQAPRMVQPPTPGRFGRAVAASAGELATLLLLLWPGWRRLYGLRLGVAAVGLSAWFLFTTPLGLSSVEQVHRRWLALVAAVLLLTAVVLLLGTAARALGRRFGR